MNYSTDPYTTPSSQYPQYSSPKTNEYYSASTPTTVQRLSYNSSDYYYYYSTPSLYSKEDHINILRRKEKLKNDIASLRLKYKQLKSELKQIKKDKVSEGEMTFLQAETKEESSKNNSIQLQNLLKELFDQIQSASAAKAFVTVFDHKLKEEEKQRKYVCDESNAIADLFDFSEYQMKCPPIQCLDQKQQTPSREQYGDDVRRLNKMRNELVTLSCPEQLSPTQIDAANSVAKLTKLQCKLSTVGLQILKADVNHLQKAYEELEMDLKKKSNDVEYVRRKLKTLEIESEQDESSHKAQLLANQATYQQSLDSLDKEIVEIKDKIDEAATKYDELIKSIDQLNEEKNSLSFSNQDEKNDDSRDFLVNENFLIALEEEEEETYEEEDILPQNDTNNAVNELNEQVIKLQNEKQILLNDISTLNSQLKSTKNRLKLNEEKMKNKIKRLYSKYSENKRLIIREENIINSSSSSNFHEGITNVLSHIEGSITLLKNGFIEM